MGGIFKSHYVFIILIYIVFQSECEEKKFKSGISKLKMGLQRRAVKLKLIGETSSNDVAVELSWIGTGRFLRACDLFNSEKKKKKKKRNEIKEARTNQPESVLHVRKVFSDLKK